ncbi:MAG: hypothetical protein JST92_26470 [Deltaproteobacteria bacterium]|nr:hypothetical protein [Deltaproteobacteria bacterium]
MPNHPLAPLALFLGSLVPVAAHAGDASVDMQPANSIALVEIHSALEQVDELRRGAFNRDHFSNVVRQGVLSAVPNLRLMSPESAAERLRGAHIDPQKATAADAPAIGRAVGADLLLTAQVLTIDDRLTLDLHLFDVRDGRMVGAGQATGDTQLTLEDNVSAAVHKVTARVPRPDLTRNRVLAGTAIGLAVVAGGVAIWGRLAAQSDRTELENQAAPFDQQKRADLVSDGESKQRIGVIGAAAFVGFAAASALFLTWSF